MEKCPVNFYYLSAKEYAKTTGLGYKDVLFQCEKGNFDCFLTEGGQWRIKVLINENSKELESLKEENTMLRGAMANIMSILKDSLSYTNKK